jgi:hypothetical protein
MIHSLSYPFGKMAEGALLTRPWKIAIEPQFDETGPFPAIGNGIYFW